MLLEAAADEDIVVEDLAGEEDEAENQDSSSPQKSIAVMPNHIKNE